MMRGLAVAGPRPSQGIIAQIKNADIEDVSRLWVELLARPASESGQRRLTHRNPDLRVTSIDQRGARIPAVRGTEIERQGSTEGRVKTPDLVFSPGHNRAKHRNLYVFCARHQMGGHDDRGRRKALQRIMMLSYAHPIEPQRLYVSDTLDHTAVGLEAARRLHGEFANLREVR